MMASNTIATDMRCIAGQNTHEFISAEKLSTSQRYIIGEGRIRSLSPLYNYHQSFRKARSLMT